MTDCAENPRDGKVAQEHLPGLVQISNETQRMMLAETLRDSAQHGMVMLR